MGLVILVCEDEIGIQKTLQSLLSIEHEVLIANNGIEGLKFLAERAIDVVITDNMMPELTGLELIRRAKPTYPQTSFLLMTAFGNVEQAVDAIKMGADDYILKPFELADMEHRIQRIQKLKNFEKKQNLRPIEATGIDRIIGHSEQVQRTKNFILQVASAPTSVLLLGPSGSGKEVMANAIHESSSRKDNVFVSVNCACLSENLLESELFGHEKGAFTGATQTKMGKFEIANGGTLFLDEIGELPLSLQAKLLRVLQEKEFYHVGGNRLLKSDVRVIAATNRSLKQMVTQGQFREDLYFRINVISFDLSPLKDRQEDIPQLVDFFLEKLSPKLNKRIFLSDATREALYQYDYPGNVRELQNIIERLLVLTPHKSEARKDLLPFTTVDSIHGSKSVIATLDGKGLEEQVEVLEKQLIEEALNKTSGNQVHAAQALKITRGALQYKIKKYLLDTAKAS